jgi:hypothetical protein
MALATLAHPVVRSAPLLISSAIILNSFSVVHRSKQPARTDGKLAGVVQVTDLVGSSTLAYFKADSDPLTALSFDPTGSLLLSCQGSGQEMTLWRISPRAKPSHRKLYVLQRGMSINQVRDIFWADDRYD